jgi:hypothetical protein
MNTLYHYATTTPSSSTTITIVTSAPLVALTAKMTTIVFTAAAPVHNTARVAVFALALESHIKVDIIQTFDFYKRIALVYFKHLIP